MGLDYLTNHLEIKQFELSCTNRITFYILMLIIVQLQGFE